MATITNEDLQIIATLNREDGRQKLSTCLGWKAFDEDFDTRSSILLDYLYDNLMFAVDKGFPWPQVLCVLQLSLDVQKQSVGKEIIDAIKTFSEKAIEYSDRISDNNLKIFTSFFFETFMTHYKIYQYVFTIEQEKNMYGYDLTVEVPIPPLPFDQSKKQKIWEYEQKIAGIEQLEEKCKEERRIEMDETLAEDNQLLRNTFKSGKINAESENEEELTETMKNRKEEIIKLIAEAARTHASAASHQLVSNIESVLEDMEFKLEKTSVPRPQVLGPPPRYRVKTPVSKGNKSGAKSRDRSRERSPKRKGSGRSSKSKS